MPLQEGRQVRTVDNPAYRVDEVGSVQVGVDRLAALQSPCPDELFVSGSYRLPPHRATLDHLVHNVVESRAMWRESIGPRNKELVRAWRLKRGKTVDSDLDRPDFIDPVGRIIDGPHLPPFLQGHDDQRPKRGPEKDADSWRKYIPERDLNSYVIELEVGSDGAVSEG